MEFNPTNRSLRHRISIINRFLIIIDTSAAVQVVNIRGRCGFLLLCASNFADFTIVCGKKVKRINIGDEEQLFRAKLVPI